MSGRSNLLAVSVVLAGVVVFAALSADALRNDDPWLVLFAVAYLLLVAGAWSVAIRSGDMLNPLTLLIVFGLIRFGLPGVLLLVGAEPRFSLYDLMDIGPGDWQRGQALAVGGLLATLLGWLVGPRRPRSHRFLTLNPRPAVSWAAWLIGILSLVLFVRANFDSFTLALVSGTFRRAEIQEGTGFFFYLGLLAIPGSVYVSAAVLPRRGRVIAAIAPVITALVLFVLGGRARSLIPLLAFWLLLWYRRALQRPALLRTLGQALLLCCALVVAAWIVYAGAMYRGGQLEALSAAGWWAYLQEAIFVDIGHLGPLAAATKLGAGSLGPENFVASLLWPVSASLGLHGRSPGVLMVEELAGQNLPGGLLPALVGDAYLNLGLLGALIIAFVFGLGMKALYRAFRAQGISPVVYALLFIYGTRLYFETIERMYEIYLVIWYLFALILAGRLRLGRVPLHRASAPAGDAVG